MSRTIFLPLLTAFFVADIHAARTANTRDTHAKPEISVLRFDNRGELTNRDKFEKLRENLAATPQTVVLFMHGWRGSASPSDNSFQSFERALEEVRQRSFRGRDRKLTGIYLTWHAEHLPSIAEYPFYYCTQKRADNIADGDGIADVIKQLSRAFRRNGKEDFIVAGHSFGGRILGHVVGNDPELLRNVDLWLLANAADAAKECEETIEAVKNNPYPRSRLPRLVWVTSIRDFATGFAFRLANLSEAAGWDRTLQTHRLSINEPTTEDPAYSAEVEHLSNAKGAYAYNLMVTNGLKGHSDVWGEPMIQIVNYFVLNNSR